MVSSEEKEGKLEAAPAPSKVARGVDMDAQFVAVIADAAKLYKESSGSSAIDAFMTPPMRSLDDLKQQVDRQNDGFTAFRKKREGLFGVLSTMLMPIELVGDIVAGSASDVFPPSQNIFAAVMFLINAAHNVSEAYDSILALFEQLKVGFSSPPWSCCVRAGHG